MALQLLPLGAWQADALSFPWSGAGQERSTSSTAGGGFSGLQEVAPPPAVQQLQMALADREPVVQILSPGDDALLGSGPWTLRLRVHDWPLVDGGALGLGPHLVVQLDQEPPRIWTETEGELPELSPGSHRLTVYAALPWGEARKNPGAVQQIRLHRTAPNPLSLPAPGSPQLLAVSPAAIAGEEPLLLDVLLLDAPLQNVGGSGTQWRLRVNVNGDSVLLDEQTPLWLRGWKPGVNAVRLEWLDGKGEPLNPPFNSLVQEVDRSTPPPTPRWQGSALNEHDLAVLLGRIPADPPPAPEPSPPPDHTKVEQAANPGPATSAATGTAQQTSAMAIPAASPPPALPARPDAGKPSRASALTDATTAGDAAEHNPVALMDASEPVVAPAPKQGNRAQQTPLGAADTSQSSSLSVVAPVQERSASEGRPAVDEGMEALVAPSSPAGSGPDPTSEPLDQLGANSAQSPAETGSPAASPSQTPVAAPSTTAGQPSLGSPADAASDGSSQQTGAQEKPESAPEDTTAAPDNVEADRAVDDAALASAAATAIASGDDGRISPSTSLSGRARDLVNADGTLKRPERRGPLAALRDRLQR